VSEHVERLREFASVHGEGVRPDDVAALLADYDTAVRERDEARRLLRDAVGFIECVTHPFDLDAARALLGTKP